MEKPKRKVVEVKVKCDCGCHTDPKMMHCLPCCENGIKTMLKFEDEIEPEKDKK